MLNDVRNLLYRRPELYELVYPEPNDETPDMLRRAFARHASHPPRSILDIGCGTGRDLASLSREVADCAGVDALPEMIELASSRYPSIAFRSGDMRSIRLGRTFDAVLLSGAGFRTTAMYDNRALVDSALNGPRLYVAAEFSG